MRLHLKREIKAMIETLDNPVQQLIMTERYINLKHWESIAVDNIYCWQQVHKIHARALRILEQQNKRCD
jgi:hypothetical protein